MKGMKVGSSVDHLPDFHGAHPRVLRDRVHPSGVIEREHQRPVVAIYHINVRAPRAVHHVRSDERSQIYEGRQRDRLRWQAAIRAVQGIDHPKLHDLPSGLRVRPRPAQEGSLAPH